MCLYKQLVVDIKQLYIRKHMRLYKHIVVYIRALGFYVKHICFCINNFGLYEQQLGLHQSEGKDRLIPAPGA